MSRVVTLIACVAAVIALALLGAASAGAQGGLTASCQQPSTESWPGESSEVHAQTFTARRSGGLFRAEVRVSKSFTKFPGDFLVEIRTVDGATGAPTSMILASATVPDSRVPFGESILRPTFASPAALVDGAQYAISVRRNAEDFSWGTLVHEGDDCPGQFWDDGGNPGFDPRPDFDMVFKVLVATCGGKVPTHVGTNGPDVINGTRGKDVIVGFRGKDRLRGFRGHDRLCGGAGKDRLKGGRGADALIGNRGRDRCAGGRASDTTARSCEIERSV